MSKPFDDFDSPTSGEVVSFLREPGNAPVDRAIVIRFAREIVRARCLRTQPYELCTIGRKSANESGAGRIVALEDLHALLVEDKGRTGDFAESQIIGDGLRVFPVTF